ncbi:hypothetical protein IAT40_005159 [Kwoniella sp. CBS 6097]
MTSSDNSSFSSNISSDVIGPNNTTVTHTDTKPAASETGWTVSSKRDPEDKRVPSAPEGLNYTFRRTSQPSGHTDLIEVHGSDSATGLDYSWAGHEEDLANAAGGDGILASVASRANLKGDRVRTAADKFAMNDDDKDIEVEWWKDSVNGDGTDSCIGYKVTRNGHTTTHGGWTDSALAEQVKVGNRLAGELFARSRGFTSRYTGAKGAVETNDSFYTWAVDNLGNQDAADQSLALTVSSKDKPGFGLKLHTYKRDVSLARLEEEKTSGAVVNSIKSVLSEATSDNVGASASAGEGPSFSQAQSAPTGSSIASSSGDTVSVDASSNSDVPLSSGAPTVPNTASTDRTEAYQAALSSLRSTLEQQKSTAAQQSQFTSNSPIATRVA